ncbi:hypothetical protein, partial [Altererythrobacter sp.]|uniref:hypothetical protein n=1 Tax=Altererythrobacter sp. TaxID=1872480 RepID=UPI003D031838
MGDFAGATIQQGLIPAFGLFLFARAIEAMPVVRQEAFDPAGVQSGHLMRKINPVTLNRALRIQTNLFRPLGQFRNPLF